MIEEHEMYHLWRETLNTHSANCSITATKHSEEILNRSALPFIVVDMINSGFLNDLRCVAGGSVITYFDDQHKFDDVDIFCLSPDMHSRTIHEFELKYPAYTHKLTYGPNIGNAFLINKYISEMSPSVQIIYNGKNTIQELFNSFDFEMCRVAINHESVVCSVNAPAVIKNKKVLTLDYPTSIKRISKYSKLGYTFDIPNLRLSNKVVIKGKNQVTF